jgi:alkylation response protein AidB-like acyl-CoA dehydrogenase
VSGGGLDLAFDDAQQAIADTVAAFCAERCPDALVKSSAGGFEAGLWRELASLGVLGLASPEAEGGSLELVAALESLGRALFPGPLAATFFATQLLEGPERRAVVDGEVVVSLGAPPLLPFASVARIFVVVAGARALRVRPRGPIEPVETLGGEPWGRAEVEPVADLGPAERALAVHDTALAAYLAAAGLRLVADAAAHARARRQFGRPIGEFQAVAHPLADRLVALESAAALARSAAFRLDRAGADAPAEAASARLSAGAAAVEAAHVAHQVFGAAGIALDGPVFHASRRIRQLASQPPTDARARERVLARLGL